MITVKNIKICKTCEKEKLLEDFNKDKLSKSGLCYECKSCEHKKDKFYREFHKEEIRERSKIYYQTHKKEMKEYNRCCYLIHKEEHRKYDRIYYLKYKKEEGKKKLEWERNNKDKVKIYGAKDRARKQNAEGSFTTQEWTDLKNKYGNICLCCRKKKKLTVDHIVPLSKGGSNYILNIQPLCKHCNCVKGTQTIDYRPKENV